MEDVLKIIGALIVMAVLGYLAVLFLSLIPALFGWGVASIVGVFTTVAEISYWGYVGIGIGIIVVANLIKALS